MGIIHLLGWTACVAVHLSVARAFRSPDWVPRLEPSLVLAVCAEIGRATAFGGLLLLAARRCRRLPFPRHPGETLLVLLGIGAAMGLVGRPLYYAAAQAHTIPLLVLQGSGFLLLAVLYLFAAVRTRILRWRVYFLTVLVAGAITVLLPLSLPLVASPVYNSVRRLLPLLSQSPRLLPGAVLLFVAAKDARQGSRYPWTHWLGIGICLWDDVMDVMFGAWVTWFVLS